MAQPVLTLEHLRDEPKEMTEKWFVLGAKVWAARVGDRFQASSGAEFWLVFFPSALENQRDSNGISCTLVSLGPWYGKTRTCNHEITGSHLPPHWLHFKPQLPPTEFKPQPDPLDQPRNGGVGLSTCPSAPLPAATSFSLLMNSYLLFKIQLPLRPWTDPPGSLPATFQI